MSSTRYRIPIKIKTSTQEAKPANAFDAQQSVSRIQDAPMPLEVIEAAVPDYTDIPAHDLAVPSIEELALDLMEVADNLERAKSYASESDPIAAGVELTLRGLGRVLAKIHVEPVDAYNQPFDPRYHEAVAVQPSPLSEGLVIEENQKGYLLRGMLLRPAKVTVSSGPPLGGNSRPTAYTE